MSRSQSQMTALAAAALFIMISAPTSAGGDKNGYGNPIGNPAEDTYQNPYFNGGDGGRTIINCDQDEVLIIEPISENSAAATCMPADED